MTNNIYKARNGSYIVQKSIKGKLYNLPVFHSLEDAEKARDEWRNNDWSVEYYIQMKKDKHQSEHHTGEKHIVRFNDKYRVDKTLNGKTYSTPLLDSIEEARSVRDEWINSGWSMDYYRKVKREYRRIHPVRSTGEKYIYPSYGGKYVIMKKSSVTGKQECYGTFDTLEEAVDERDLLIRYDWDWNLICDEGL